MKPLCARRVNLRRRILGSFVVALGSICLPLPAVAQSPARVWRIGVLNPRARAAPGGVDAYTRFFDAMRELGYVDGRNMAVRWHSADNELNRLPGLAAQLVQAKVDLIVTNGTPAVRAAQQATRTIPIVALTFTDPVSNKFAASLARPGGNITGTSIIEEDLLMKRFEILSEILPRAKRIAYLANSDNAKIEAQKFARLEAVARKAGKATVLVEARTANELNAAFDSMTREGADAVLVAADTVLIDYAQRIGTLALQRKLPSIMSVESIAEHCLATYGPDPVRRGQRAAALADKILKGANPAELPIELPTHFNLVVNLKTAKALGVTIPPVVMVQATKVIQ